MIQPKGLQSYSGFAIAILNLGRAEVTLISQIGLEAHHRRFDSERLNESSGLNGITPDQ